ncbi:MULTISPECIES: GAD-like domain-containing protein [Pseudoalteromonas]|uniref:Glutamyl-tRNA amidotransferase n=1 Tax=Pseudoalteromonas piscicida TaxID=43662 RepID=A0A2A5JNN8_PSEO7|nr:MULTISPECIES: GAD-like domain-containing protein [Pseudoalteromonas]PAY01975.1 glutamyl-tRNA amidotransferase [Pseudoalteromonas sp. HM-SA03]PCK31062.1 glutamyl-tRNA amidotransferase [Pseudoalteromonas piscicida]
MNEYFEEFYNFGGFGPAIKEIKPTGEDIKAYKGLLPDNLLEYWKEYGFCGWGAGRLWMVNPADYQDVLDSWLKSTRFEQMQRDGLDNFSVIAIDAFGEVYIWGKNSGNSLSITSCYGMIFPTFNDQEFIEDGKELTLDLFFANKVSSEIDLTDHNEQPLFERAVEKLGPLENGEIYGFVPALALGGEPKLENLQKVKATEHLAFLADLGEKRVMADIVALSNQLPHNQ